MRKFSSNVQFLLQQDEINIFYMVSIATKSGVLYHTTAAYDMVFDGNTYVADSELMIVDAPRLSTSVDRESYKLTYADPTFAKRALFESILTGSAVSVMIGFLNSSDITLSGVSPGQPMLDPADVIIAYRGVVDTQGYAIAPNDGTVIAVIECSSPMANLGLIRSFLTTKSAMNQVNKNDTAFDQASVNSSKTTYLWGKA